MRRTATGAWALAFLAPGCAVQVTHPTATAAEMQVDIDYCTDEASRHFWYDNIAALYRAYDCLEAKGYKRGRPDFERSVEASAGKKRTQASEPPRPCQVPCRK